MPHNWTRPSTVDAPAEIAVELDPTWTWAAATINAAARLIQANEQYDADQSQVNESLCQDAYMTLRDLVRAATS